MVKQSIRRFSFVWIISAAIIVTIGWTSTAMAGLAIPVDWDNSSEGTLVNSTVVMFNVTNPSLEAFDLSGPDYAAAPLSSNQVTVSYDTLSDWTTTFDPPVENLLLYVVFWRGVAGGQDPVTYQFDQPFTILSGLGGTSVSNGNTLLSVPSAVFARGILQFAGPVSSLTVQTNSNSGNAQSLTFGILPPAPPAPPTATIPTLSEWGLMATAVALGIAGLIVARRRKAAA